MRRITIVTICLFTSALFICAEAFACSCLEEPEEVSRARGDLIFIGTVIRVEGPRYNPPYNYEKARYTFAVKEILKGSANKEITVITTMSCPISFDLGSKYIISASIYNQEYYTNSCLGDKWLGDEKPSIILLARENPRYLILGGAGIVMALAAGLLIWLSRGKRAT